ncbi:unnamed protein product [Trifolium pratense]|uniref:Uncharacterized protein n=1 Tax=Trifolium pratense TaxID=57577 RepID=A0ACB0JJR4_TRIPR|nr:unnamed protein product [Trifolium pratense]
MKLAWNMVNEPTALWVRVLKSKYKCDEGKSPNVQLTHSCSSTWRAIVSVWDKMIEGMQWSIGNGRTINFWSHSWLPLGIVLNNIVMQPIDPQIASKTVAYFSDNNGGWQLQEAVNMIPAYVIDQIQGCTAAADNLGEDRPSWPYSSNGVFAVKTAYDFLLSTRTSDRVLWNNIWKWEGPQKIKASYGW